jgi:S-adenosylmethionine decarboxylase
MPERACSVLKEELNAAHFNLKSFLRETPSEVAGADRAPVATAAAALLN